MHEIHVIPIDYNPAWMIAAQEESQHVHTTMPMLGRAAGENVQGDRFGAS